MDSIENMDHYLKIFYKRLFPCELICKLLSNGSGHATDVLSRREFSFSLAGDVYIRYQSFNDAIAFRKELVKICPHKIDIGAVYAAPPKFLRPMHSTSLTPEWKELVFDVDLTDYDEIRFCCGSNNPGATTAICHNCWELAKCAVICMDRALRDDFGFRHILWVFSGRRGVHCWVCDAEARRLDSTGRTAIAEYLALINGSDAKKLKQKLMSRLESRLHPSVETAVGLLSSRFTRYCVSQDFLSPRYPNRVWWVLQHLPTDLTDQRDKLLKQWTSENVESNDSTAKRWNTLKSFLQDKGHKNVVKDIILDTLYPRLDIKVTTGTGHLLKSPFCVHPKTGYICVPIDPRQIEEFNPLSVPRLSELVEQLTQANSIMQTTSPGEEALEVPTSQHLLPYKRTVLSSYIEFFENFVNHLSDSTKLGAIIGD